MRPFRLPFAVVFLVLLSGPFPACRKQREGTGRGPFTVGTRELMVQGAPPLPATLWYPAANPDQAREEIIYQSATEGAGRAGQTGPIRGHALVGAPLEPSVKRYPLVLFAPDRSRGRMLYAELLEQWASHGFLVIAFGRGDWSAPDPIQFFWVLACAESLTASNPELASRIDTGRVALAGHGEGALAALAAAGQASRLDPRVKAVLALGPPDNGEELVKGAAVRVPSLILSGSRAEPLYRSLAADPKAQAILVDGGHDLFGIAADEVAVSMDIHPLETGTWDIHRAREVIHPLTSAFLQDLLQSDPAAHRALLPGALGRSDVLFTSTWK